MVSRPRLNCISAFEQVRDFVLNLAGQSIAYALGVGRLLDVACQKDLGRPRPALSEPSGVPPSKKLHIAEVERQGND